MDGIKLSFGDGAEGAWADVWEYLRKHGFVVGVRRVDGTLIDIELDETEQGGVYGLGGTLSVYGLKDGRVFVPVDEIKGVVVY